MLPSHFRILCHFTFFPSHQQGSTLVSARRESWLTTLNSLLGPRAIQDYSSSNTDRCVPFLGLDACNISLQPGFHGVGVTLPQNSAWKLRVHFALLMLATVLYVCLSVRLSFRLSVRLSVHLSVCLSFHLSVHLSVCLSICLSVCLSVCPSIHLSVCLSSLAAFPRLWRVTMFHNISTSGSISSLVTSRRGRLLYKQ